MGACCGRPRGDVKKDDGDNEDTKDIELTDYDEEARIEFGPLYMFNEEKSDINTLDIKRRYRYNIESVYF
ncbi:hypothetical protein RCNV-85A-028 [Raccoonpox virus]|uniref:Protein OPG051 n=1 Tax=Raccoon poxvirus TaxID=10256 RepID=A0A0G3FZY2_RACVI|nr:hypothetical protein ACG19_gp040 [Raccoonpox virus]AKJ93674.1 hypothetical protein RCNV-Herman-040 [Raccoonpox virus]AOP31305.1 hypothetical protein RCNV-85A-028 [Raccoonpox virus]